MNNRLLEWALRLGIAGEFVGHGVFALEGKRDWIGWFAKFGINNPSTAKTILFYIGLTDLVMAALIFAGLAKKLRFILLWAVVWGFWTALLRPIVGMPVWDFIERWANWGAPLALLGYYGWPRSLKEWFSMKISNQNVIQ